VVDGGWLERLKLVLRAMDSHGGSYPLHRYLEELIEADIVYREGIRSRGPFLPRHEILQWLRQRHAGSAARKVSSGNEKGRSPELSSRPLRGA
jgi:uncharacterized iron-regulated membrane protein